MKKIVLVIILLFSIVANALMINSGVCEIGVYTTQTTGDIITSSGWQHDQPLTTNLRFNNGSYFVETIWNNDKSEKQTSRVQGYICVDGTIKVLDGNIVFFTMETNFFTVKQTLPDNTIHTYTNIAAILFQVAFAVLDAFLVVMLVLAFKKKN